MVRTVGVIGSKLTRAAILVGAISCAAHAQEDPPDRVARLNYINGNVSMEPAGIDDWAPADVNRPFTIGDYLYTDQGAAAELHLDVAAIRMSSNTSFGFLNLDDRTVQLKLTEGDMYFHLHDFGPDQVFEVDTPNAAVTLLRDGTYRFRVDPNGNMSFVVVRDGQAEITGGGQSFILNPGNSATLTGTEQLSFDVAAAPTPDAFDNWCGERDAHERNLTAERYLPPTVIGYEDLDQYGDWQQTKDYGPVWYPRSVAAGWAPYHSGHWAWIEPWGWTWVDDMPWGFAPFHYGRWAYIGSRWGWCPGPIARVGYTGPVVRPYYAPAMVAWFGGAHWGVSVSVGGGPNLGWVPLGYGEIYTPPYACSRPYFNNVNVYNTRVVKTVNITNVYHTVYVNRTVYNQQFVNVKAPNAVMAMPQAAFAGGRSVRQAGVAVRQAELARLAPAVVIAPPVAPTRQAVAPTLGRRAPRPIPQVVQRQVVARNVPPAAPASFSARQQYLDAHTGQPHNFEAMHQAVVPQQHQVAAVRVAPPARAVAAVPGEPRAETPANYRPAPPSQTHQPNLARESKPARQAAPAPAFAPDPSPVRERRATVQPHGVPPNARQGSNGQPAENGRVTERNRPEANPPQPRPQPPSYSERTQPQARPQPNFAERSQSEEEARPQRPASPEARQGREQNRPAPENRQAAQSRVEARPAGPSPRVEPHGAEQHGQPPSHEAHGRPAEHKENRDTKDHQK